MSSKFTDDSIELRNYIFPKIETYNKLNVDYSYELPLNEDEHIEFGYDGRIIDSNQELVLQITDTLGYTLKANVHSLFKRYIHGLYWFILVDTW